MLPAFLQVTELLFDHVWNSWGQLLNDILARLPTALAAPNTPAPPALLMAFERWLLLLKVCAAQQFRHCMHSAAAAIA